MPHHGPPSHRAVLLAAGLLAATSGSGSAQAQSDEPTQRPLAGAELGDDTAFNALDFSLPATAAPAAKFDASKFTATKTPGTGWDAKAGVDYAPTTPASALPSDLLLPTATAQAQSGPAWANVTAPALDTPLTWDKATIETRVDPQQDQSKLGMKFSRSVPIGSELSLTVQNDYSMTQTLPSAVISTPAVPVTTTGTTTATTTTGTAASRVLDTNQALKVNILPSATSFSVGATVSTTDSKWLRSFSAEQKLFGGPLNITGSVSQTTTGELNKTLKAGFKQSW